MPALPWLPRNQRLWLKAKSLEARRIFVRAFLSYDVGRLKTCLRSLGLRDGDSAMLHSAFAVHFGFRGSIDELTNAFLDVVGPDGNLLMVSLPYRSSALQYLSTLKQFDVRNTPSMMGLVSEHFRRRAGVRRSLHPTHPILVHGPRTDWFIGAHPACLYPCGPDTPFERLAAVDGKAVFFNVPFAMFTFFHYLEHLVSPDLPFSLYTEKPFLVPVIDEMGQARTVTTYAYTAGAISRRRFHVLEDEMRRRQRIREARIGNSRILVVNVRDAVECVEDMRRSGRYFYEMGGAAEGLDGGVAGVP